MEQIINFCISALLVLGLANSCSEPSIKAGTGKIEPSVATTATADINHSPVTTGITSLFTLSDAQKILGEAAHLADSGSTVPGEASKHSANDSVLPIKKQASSCRCAYEANAQDKTTGRTGKIYFLIERYPDVSSAATVYSYYKRSNQSHPGFKELYDLGDEGWFGPEPLFAYVRKSNKILVMKVNQMTSLTSLDEFNLVVKKIATTFLVTL